MILRKWKQVFLGHVVRQVEIFIDVFNLSDYLTSEISIHLSCFCLDIFIFNRYRRKPPKVDASIFDSALSHTLRSEASEKRGEKSASIFGRFRLWTSFEFPPVSVNKQTDTSIKILTTCLTTC